MAPVIYLARTRIPAQLDDEFNRWYDEEHVPQHLEFHGAVGARRYRFLEPSTLDNTWSELAGSSQTAGFQYLALYEYRDIETLKRYLKSDLRASIIDDHVSRFGKPIAAVEAAEQIWP